MGGQIDNALLLVDKETEAQRGKAVCPKTHSKSSSETWLLFLSSIYITELPDDLWARSLIDCKDGEGRFLAWFLY